MAFPFNPDFEINIALPLAEAAYDAANEIPLKLPNGYTKVAEITADIGKVAAHIATAKPSPQMLFRAMLLDVKKPNVFGIVAKNGDTGAIVFRGTQRAEEWLKDFDAEHVPYQPVAGFGTVHDGFQKIYDTTAASVKAGLAGCGSTCRRSRPWSNVSVCNTVRQDDSGVLSNGEPLGHRSAPPAGRDAVSARGDGGRFGWRLHAGSGAGA